MKAIQRDDLRKHITPYRIANGIRTLRNNRENHSFLIVEGDDDARVYGQFVAKNQCIIQVAHFKDVAVGAILELDKTNTKGVLAIVDADYERIEGNVPASQNILFTDTHDLETMILSSSALDKVVIDFSPSTSLQMIEELTTNIRNTLLRIGTEIGYYRWVNFRSKLFLSFKDLPYDIFLLKDSLVVDQERLFQILTTGRNKSLYLNDISKEIAVMSATNPDPWEVSQGHDLVNLLRIVLPHYVSVMFNSSKALVAQKKARGFRFSDALLAEYEEALFAQTRLHSLIKDWEVKNTPYLILGQT